jgi:hypothetical protein
MVRKLSNRGNGVNERVGVLAYRRAAYPRFGMRRCRRDREFIAVGRKPRRAAEPLSDRSCRA